MFNRLTLKLKRLFRKRGNMKRIWIRQLHERLEDMPAEYKPDTISRKSSEKEVWLNLDQGTSGYPGDKGENATTGSEVDWEDYIKRNKGFDAKEDR